VVSQCLVPLKDGGGRVAATEILIGTDAAMNPVRTGKCQQLNTTIQMGKSLRMHTLNSNLAELVKSDQISKGTALEYCSDKSEMNQLLNSIR